MWMVLLNLLFQMSIYENILVLLPAPDEDGGLFG